jgi:hypothetical protein
MMSIANRYFTRLGKYEVIVCKECRYAVWLAEVDAHLGGKHHEIKKEERRVIKNAIDSSWRGLIQEPNQFIVPGEIDKAVPKLPLYDGFVCKLDPENCQGIYCGKRSIMQHWEEQHNWNVTGKKKRGGLTRAQKKVAED